MADAAEIVALEAIVFKKTDGGFVLDMDAWPERAEFSVWQIASRPERVRFYREHIDIRLDNARAVYRVDELNPWLNVYATTLVYSGGP